MLRGRPRELRRLPLRYGADHGHDGGAEDEAVPAVGASEGEAGRSGALSLNHVESLV